jgi:gliding motility-associated-like protein
MKQVLILLLVILSWMCLAQVPIINEITPVSTYPTNRILIKGSGFVNTPNPLRVWFDQVAGNVVSSSEFSVVVDVPNGRLANVQVTNGNGLSAKSPLKFTPSYGGTDFDPAKLGTPASISGGINEVFDVCSCDLDGDGKPDLAATKQGATATDIIVSRNASTIGSLSFVTTLVATSSSMANLACGDLDGDGKPELLASRAGSTRNEIFIFKNNSSSGTISLAAPTKLLIDVGQFAFRINIRDMNLDGKPDLIVTNSNVSTGDNTIYIFSNQSSVGSVSFNSTPVKVPITGATTTYGLDVQDLDGDRRPEIIVNQFNNSDIFIVPNTSSGSLVSFGTVQRIAVTGTLNHLATADFNKDGKLDIAVTSAFDKKAFLLLNTSSGNAFSFAAPLTMDTGDGPFGIDVADIDGDDDADIVIGNIGISSSSTELTVLSNNGNTSSPGFTTFNINVGKASRNVRVGDLDGDGKPDIAYTTVAGNSLDIIRNANCFVPKIITEAPLTICATQTLQLDSKPNAGVTLYQWKESGSALGTNSSTLTINAAGNYTVTATSESGACVITTSTFNVISGSGSLPSDPSPSDVSSNSVVCAGNSINLSTTLSGSFTYEWEGPNGFTSTQQNPTITAATLDNAGSYSLKLSNGTCKTSAVSTQVDIASLKDFSITSSVSSNILCEGSALTLTVNTQPGYTYQWKKDGSDISGETGATLSVTQKGSCSVLVTNTALACSALTNAIDVAVLALPVADFTVKSTACVNENLIFTDASQIDAAGTAAYSWDFGDTGTGSSPTISHAYSTTKTFTARLTISYTNLSGCSGSKSHDIAVVAGVVPVITSSSDGICPDQSMVLSISGDYKVINWSDGSISNTSTINQAGTYTVNTVDVNGCTGKGEIIIEDNPPLTLDVTADKTVLIPGQSAQLQANVNGNVSFLWTPAESLSDSTISNPIASPQVTTTYGVVCTADGLCPAQKTITIQVSTDLAILKIPNVFSPNGDGINDMWLIPGMEAFPDCTLSLYDQNGRKLLEEKGYTNFWDGNYSGKPVTEGTYYFVIGCPDKKSLTGTVLVAR